MQTFFNPTTPFLDSEGRPMVGARVSFLDLDSSVLPRLIKSPYKTYFLNIPYFMRVRKRFCCEKIRNIGYFPEL